MITLTVFELRAYRLPQNDLFLISLCTSTLVNIIFFRQTKSEERKKKLKCLLHYDFVSSSGAVSCSYI